ncbi:DUF2207 domain-containing protein [Agromyces sp. SYSU K20354]|uniref:DUF2207 family protein n=1 Tax=Agromyces cavernae TaxID=2898659 RepID=UPI001E3DA1F9|nr:DUF2207 domain-containing protein [Agromyces cavernae]MCD2443853.1 DUF2207 domain-containing protein [Agromyces cavernae]
MARPGLARVISVLIAAAALTAAPAASAVASNASARGDDRPGDRVVAAASAIGEPAPNVENFSFRSFDAVYELSRDADGRSVLETTETLVAQFPEFDQNRGIRRAIPLDYDGHPTDLVVESVTDASGAPRAFETESDEAGEFLLVTVRADGFVHGEQTYVITYGQHNVTFEPDDAAIDEFFWDVNGTGWSQPFGSVRAELRLDPDLVDPLTGDAACYRGPMGSTQPCDSLVVDPPTVTAEAASLGPFENLSFAVAFRDGTFEPRDESFGASAAAITGAVGAALAVLAMLTAIVLRAGRWRNHPGRGTIIAQYEPPAGISAMEAADLAGHAGKGVTATILERAVAGELRVVETGRRRYAVDFVGGELGDRDAQSVVRALYRDNPYPGARRALKSRDARLGRELLSLRQHVHKRVVLSGLRHRPDLGIRLLLAVVAVAAAVLSVVFGIIALDDRRGGPWPFLLFVIAIVAALVTVVIVAGVRPLTESGRAARDHLEGLRLYIRLAEADRLRVLQSPSGALRVGAAGVGAGAAAADVIGANIGAGAVPDPATVLKLNERLLPYSVLFGLEREWSEVLAELYAREGGSPNWYSGTSGFNAGAFAVGVSTFSSASSASWSGSSSSSSSSGSGGGGSSGGGGGGGGGGGV